MKTIVSCPSCQGAVDLTNEPAGSVSCSHCSASFTFVGPLSLHVNPPNANKQMDWFLGNLVGRSSLAESLPKTGCVWCGTNTGIRNTCKECGCDLSKTGHLLYKESAADAPAAEVMLMDLIATGPVSVLAKLFVLNRLSPAQALGFCGDPALAEAHSDAHKPPEVSFEVESFYGKKWWQVWK